MMALSARLALNRLCCGLVLALPASCASYSANRYTASDAKAVTGVVETTQKVESLATDCDLRLFIEQRPSGGTYGIPKDRVGVTAVERVEAPAAKPTEGPAAKPAEVTGGTSLRDGICIKKKDAEINLPAGVLVASVDGDDLTRFCDDGTEEGTVNGEPVKFCHWNGVFHASRPFTFTLLSAPGTSVGDLVEFARIYRNGDLVAAWNRSGDQKQKNQVVLGGNGLRSRFFAPSQPPNLADLDIRIIPRDAQMTEAVDMKVRDDVKGIEARLGTALKAGADEALPPDSPARASLDCLKQTVVHARAQILETIHGKVQVPQLDAGCTMPLTATQGTPLKDEYEKVENQGRAKLLALKDDAQARLERARIELEKQLPPAATAALEKGARALKDKATGQAQKAIDKYLKDNGNTTLLQLLQNESDKAKLVDQLKKDTRPGDVAENLQSLNDLYRAVGALATDVNSQIKTVLATVDEAHALANELYSQARQIAANPERQAQIFNALAQSLHDQGDVFEARRDNPPLLLNEQKIPMAYSDHTQLFVLAPWNGVPVRLSGDVGADFNAGVIVPIIDVIGLRYQWSRNRMADFRAAVGIGYTQTKFTNDDGTDVTETGALPNFSLGLANFKFGLGIVTGESHGAEFKERLRFIMGADLYKLISGTNVEAF